VPRIRKHTKKSEGFQSTTVASPTCSRAEVVASETLVSTAYELARLGDNAYSFVLSPEPYAADPIDHYPAAITCSSLSWASVRIWDRVDLLVDGPTQRLEILSSER
jgi:hypothetical protein